MTTQSRDIVLFIEHNRVLQKYNQQKFCEGIISERNYRRYLNDDVQVKFDVVLKFIDRLGYTFQAFFDALKTHKDSLDELFETLDKTFRNYEYTHAKRIIQEIKAYIHTLTSSRLDKLKLYERLIQLYESLKDFQNPKDQASALHILNETKVLSMLDHTYYTYDEFMFINVLMNKIYNLLPLNVQTQFNQFYVRFISGEHQIIGGNPLEHIQQIYSYYVSSIFGKNHVTKKESKQGGQYIKDGIFLTRQTHMIYNLMALNYLNSSVCYSFKDLDAGKKSAYYTFMSVFAQDNSAGFIPAFKTAFSLAIPTETLKRHLLKEWRRHVLNDLFYYEEVTHYHDLSSFYHENN